MTYTLYSNLDVCSIKYNLHNINISQYANQVFDLLYAVIIRIQFRLPPLPKTIVSDFFFINESPHWFKLFNCFSAPPPSYKTSTALPHDPWVSPRTPWLDCPRMSRSVWQRSPCWWGTNGIFDLCSCRQHVQWRWSCRRVRIWGCCLWFW